MKKISYLLTVVLALAVAACDNTPRELTELMPDKPYLFYSDGCPHCHEAQEFLNRKYPGLNIIKVSVDNKDGARLMSQCAPSSNSAGRSVFRFSASATNISSAGAAVMNRNFIIISNLS